MSVCSLFHMWILSFGTMFYFLRSAVTWRRSYMVPTGRLPTLWWGQSVIYASIKCFVLYVNLIWTSLFFSKWDHKNEVEDSVSFNLPNRDFKQNDVLLLSVLVGCLRMRSCCWLVSELKEERKKKDVCVVRKSPAGLQNPRQQIKHAAVTHAVLNGTASLSLAITDNYFCRSIIRRQLLSKYSLLLNFPLDSWWKFELLRSEQFVQQNVASLTAWHERHCWWFPAQSW